MAISKDAINEYMNRQIESMSWIKKLSEQQLDEEISRIDPPHKFTAKLRPEQKACFFMAIAYPHLVFMLDLGLGKTVITLEVLSYFYMHGFLRRAVVFAPTDELVEGWEDEIKKFGFKIPYVLLRGSSAKKWQSLEGFKEGIIIGTYMGISAMVAETRRVLKPDGKYVNKRVIKPSLIQEFTAEVDAVVFDQSTKISNRGSLSYLVGNVISQHAQIRMSLAGRAFGRDPVLLWAQFYLADRGIAFGNSISLFRESFYRMERHTWGIRWVLRKRRENILTKFCSASSLRYSAEECLTLPAKSYTTVPFNLPSENQRFYNDLYNMLSKNDMGEFIKVKNTFIRMRQISSGFIGVIDEDSDERTEIVFQQNPKLEILKQKVEELPPDKKMIIVYDYTWSGRLIDDTLTKMKVKHGWLWSGTKDWTEIKEAFNHDPDFRVLVMNYKKGGMGLNLQVASYMVFYESPVSVIDRAECEGRIYRSGQQNKCHYFDLVAKNTVDETVLLYHKEGTDLWKRLIDNFGIVGANTK